MDNVFINNEILFKSVTVVKSRFPLYFLYVANDIPLPPLPYSVSLTASGKVTYRRVDTNHNWAYGPQPLVYEQPQAWWSDSRNAISTVLQEWNSFVTDANKVLDNLLLSKLKEQSISIGTMYAERRQTNELIIKTLEKFVRAVKLVKHPKLLFRELYGRGPSRSELLRLRSTARHASRKAKTVGDAWLMYRYAWTPLVLDVRDALQALCKQNKKMYRHSVRADVRLDFKGSPTRVSFAAWNDLDTIVTGFYGSHIKCFFDVTNPLATAWSSLSDPFQVAWDLVPFSFVVDWFCDVSTALDLRSATWGTTFTAGYRSVMSSRTIDSVPVHERSYYWWNGGLNSSERETIVVPPARVDITVNRSVLSQFPPLHLVFPLEEGINVARVLDLAALLQTYVHKKL